MNAQSEPHAGAPIPDNRNRVRSVQERLDILEEISRSDPSNEEIALLATLFQQSGVQDRIDQHIQQAADFEPNLAFSIEDEEEASRLPWLERAISITALSDSPSQGPSRNASSIRLPSGEV